MVYNGAMASDPTHFPMTPEQFAKLHALATQTGKPESQVLEGLIPKRVRGRVPFCTVFLGFSLKEAMWFRLRSVLLGQEQSIAN